MLLSFLILKICMNKQSIEFYLEKNICKSTDAKAPIGQKMTV